MFGGSLDNTAFFLRKEIKMEDKKLPEYEVPKVITYTDEEILDELVRHRSVSTGGNNVS